MATDPTDPTDPIDLARLAARDPVLLARLVEKVGSRIWVAIRRYARDDDHADALVQGCWQAILERLDRYGGRGSFVGWAIAVSENVCLAQLRKAKRAGGREVGLEEPDEVVDPAPDPEEEVTLSERRNALYRALGQLPKRERDAIVLRMLEERDTAETARALGLSREATRSLVARAIFRLRRMREVQQLAMDWMV